MTYPSALAAAAVAALAIPSPRAQAPVFEPPIQLTAGGSVIDTAKDGGYAGVVVRDLNGDSLPDLLVTSLMGTIRSYENVGTRARAQFREGAGLPEETGGNPIRLHNW